jgi:5-methylcytosine-specific restriction enzyme subunit McrC
VPVLTTWEGMEIPFPEGFDTRWAGNRLMQVAERSSLSAFRWKKGRLHAAEVVGCVQVGNLRVNILPKLDTAERDRDKDFLLNMLHSAGYLSKPYAGSAEVRQSVADPLEAMVSEVATEMLAALRDGVPRRYEEKREDLSTVRGRIDFSRLSTRLPGDALLPLRHSPLANDNELSQCIKAIAQFLYRLTRSSSNRQSLAIVLSHFVSVRNLLPSLAQLDALILTRQESPWSKTLSVGRLLLAGHAPDPTFSGDSDAFSLLFPLQHLFERTLRKVLAAAFQGSDVRISHRSDSLFLLEDPVDQAGVLRLKPDYVFERSSKLLAVADAKWKRAAEFGRAHSVGRDDLYQVNAYLTRYGVRNAFILLPRANWMEPGWLKSYHIAEAESHIHLLGIDIEALVGRDQKARQLALSMLSGSITQVFDR